jgi:hypothetical protein
MVILWYVNIYCSINSIIIINARLKSVSSPFFFFPSSMYTSYVNSPIHVRTRMCIKKEGKREGKRYVPWFLLENLFLKIFAGNLSICLRENFTIYSVFHALSNDVIFINSARDQKFRTSWYDMSKIHWIEIYLLLKASVYVFDYFTFNIYIMRSYFSYL